MKTKITIQSVMMLINTRMILNTDVKPKTNSETATETKTKMKEKAKTPASFEALFLFDSFFSPADVKGRGRNTRNS